MVHNMCDLHYVDALRSCDNVASYCLTCLPLHTIFKIISGQYIGQFTPHRQTATDSSSGFVGSVCTPVGACFRSSASVSTV